MDSSQRNLLLGNSSNKATSTNPFEDDSFFNKDEDTHNLSNIKQQQKSALKEQDKGLNTLLGAVRKQKQMATDIGNELDEQDQIIDQIGTSMHNVTESVALQNRLTEKTYRKSGTCCMHVTIILLLVVIVLVAVIPKK